MRINGSVIVLTGGAVGLKHGELGAGSILGSVLITPIKDLLAAGGLAAGIARNRFVSAVRQQPAGFHIILQADLQRRQQAIAGLRLFDRNQQFHTSVQIAGHPVGAGNKQPLIAAVVEVRDPAVFQKPVNHARNRDILAETGDAGA